MIRVNGAIFAYTAAFRKAKTTILSGWQTAAFQVRPPATWYGTMAPFLFILLFSGKQTRQGYRDDKRLLLRSDLLPHDKERWHHFCLYSCFQVSKDDNTIWMTNSCFSDQNSWLMIRDNGAIFVYTAAFRKAKTTMLSGWQTAAFQVRPPATW